MQEIVTEVISTELDWIRRRLFLLISHLSIWEKKLEDGNKKKSR